VSVTYRVAEQFVSINGEGTRAGELAVFVRLCGCNLQCSYCDTQWANQPDVSYQLQTTEEIIQAILETGLNRRRTAAHTKCCGADCCNYRTADLVTGD